MTLLVGIPQFLNALLRHGNIYGDRDMQSYALSSQAISLGCKIIVIVFLIRKADWLASLVFPQEREIGFSFSASDLRAALFSAIALYFVLDGARHALGSAYLLVARPRGDSPNAASYLWQRAPESLVRSLGGLIAGALLLGRPRRLIDFGKNIFGRAPEAEDPELADEE